MNSHNKRKLWVVIALVVVAGLLVGGYILMTSKTNQKEMPTQSEEPRASNLKDLDSEDGEDGVISDDELPTVWIFNKEVVADWSVPVPLVNPLGAEDLYEDIIYVGDDYQDYYYYSQKLYVERRRSYGESWRLRMPKIENSQDPDFAFFIRDFMRYVEEMGGTNEGTHSYGLVFSLENPDGMQCWGRLNDYGDAYELDIVHERSLLIGQTLEIAPEDYPNQEVSFMSYNTTGDFLSAEVFIEGGTATLAIDQRRDFDTYKREHYYSAELDSDIETYYRLNDLPLEETYAIWKLSWNDAPQALSVTLNTLGKLTPIQGSEDLGAVVISAKEARNVRFFADGYEPYIEHAEYNEDPSVDRTVEGDFIVYLPSGMWRAEIAPRGSSLVDGYGTQLIPVQAGYKTTIQMPYLLEKAFSVDESSLVSTQGLKIENISDLGDKVSFDFTLVDKASTAINPTLDNTSVHEGSDEVELLSLTRVLTPPSVALLIDSSGSMKGQMDATLEAAKAFIEGLPDGSHIRVIDFDTEVRILEGTTKEEGVKSLGKISVGGYTALFDGALASLELVEALDRATVVVFTDGTNELPASKITASMTSLEAVMSRIEGSSAQFFTIGFGKGHDGSVLKQLAKAGNGQYFSAEDQNALSAVFQAINEKINATYTATYKRPTQAAPSDVPLVNIVVDVSGSMDMTWDETTGHRMEKMKNLFHDFVMSLPDQTQIQVMSFNDKVYINQMMTSDKLKVLRAIGLLQAGGGTNILDSVKVGYKTLAAIPSTQKVMVYLTDAALAVSDEERLDFDALLKDIAQEDVNVLWLGLGDGLNEADFKHSAELSNGSYIISENADLLKESTDALLASIGTKKDESISTLSIEVKDQDERGQLAYFSASEQAELAPIKRVGKAELVDSIRYVSDTKLDQYDGQTSKFISGSQLPKEAVKILKRLVLDRESQNEAMSIKANELVFMSAFNGVKAPDGMRFAAVFVELSHILPKQEVVVYPDGSGHPANWVNSSSAKGKIVQAEVPYSIPNAFNHFSLSFNNEGTYPLSPATWIAEKSLVNPGENALYLAPRESLEGTLVFLVPAQNMHQISMHYYDTDYGHIHMPLVGEMTDLPELLEALPLDVGTQLHKGFELVVDDAQEKLEIGKRALVNENNVFKVVQGRFKALLQANLTLNPKERIHLTTQTDYGDFYYPIDASTELLPFGMLSEQMVSPGASNAVAFSFLIPDFLKNHQSRLMIDLVDQDVYVPVQSGSVYSSGEALVKSSHEYFDVSVNELVFNAQSVAGLSTDYVVLDLTVYDKKDGFASRGVIDSFRLVQEGYLLEDLLAYPDLDLTHEIRLETALSSSGLSGFASPKVQESELLIAPSSYTSQLVLGFDDDSVIYDGTARRGYVVFRVNPDTPYTLQSSMFKDLNVPVSEGKVDLSHLTLKQQVVYDNDYTLALSEAIQASIIRYETQKTALSHAASKRETLDPNGEERISVEPPMMALDGAIKWNRITTLDELMRQLKSIKIIYDSQDQGGYQALYRYEHAPEAIFTQGWGTISDVTHAAIKGLSKVGYQPKRYVVNLSQYGIEQLGKYLDQSNHGITQLPAIGFVVDGKQHMWLMPYMKDFNTLKTHGTYSLDGEPEFRSQTIHMNVSYLVELNGQSFAAKAADASSALSGSTHGNEPYWQEVFSESLDLEDLSKGCFDLGVTMIKDGYTPLVTTLSKTYKGKEGIDPNGYDILAVAVELDLKGQSTRHVIHLPDDGDIESVFMTLGINLPNFTSETYESLAIAADTLNASVNHADDISALKWYGRSVIAKYMALQTSFEKRLALAYDLEIAHISKDQGVIVTQMVYEGNHTSQINLLNPVTRVISSDESEEVDRKKRESYYLMSGLHASVAEARVLHNGVGILEMWASLADSTDYMLIPSDVSMESLREEFISLGMSEAMVDHFNYNSNYLLVPSQSARVNGRERWAWFEINPNTYEVISVLDDFSKGGLSEKAVTDAVKSSGQYMIGVLVGVDVSLWSVAAFSLELDDYEEILKAAYEFAMGLKPFFNMNSGPASMDFGSGEASLGVGPIKGNFGLVDAEWKGSLGENVLGFTNGYEEGVKLYFDIAK